MVSFNTVAVLFNSFLVINVHNPIVVLSCSRNPEHQAGGEHVPHLSWDVMLSIAQSPPLHRHNDIHGKDAMRLRLPPEKMTSWIILFLIVLSVVLLFLLGLLIRRKSEIIGQSIKITVRDLSGLCILIRMRLRCSRAFYKNEGIQTIFLNIVRHNPTKEAIYDMTLTKSFTFTELDELACRYGHMLQAYSKPGDVIAICMDNGVHFVAAWLGCAKVGLISAWINTSLRGSSLLHSLKISNASIVLCSASYQQAVDEVLDDEMPPKEFRPIIFSEGFPKKPYIKSIDELIIQQLSSQPITQHQMTFQDRLCYIFTSGTTGMPKPAVIKHFRFFYIATSGECAFGIRPKTDRIYVCLPLYHTSAGILGIGQTVIHGATCVIRGKFSSKNFWNDCITYKCTVSQYIGELLRYLLLNEKSEYELSHNIRLLIGNGLRPMIWHAFQERFKVKRIAEFYGSTEGTSNLVNIDGKEGACGFMTTIKCLSFVYPIRIFKVNEETGKLIRDKCGYCIPIRPGESGMLACSIRKNNPLYHFEGYLDNIETEKKVIREPFPGSDPVFLSGDIVFWDKLGYLYFKDRIGDTYRWKGENVSTTQVETVLHAIGAVRECAVYGVEIPGCEGRAGMASITPNIEFTPEVLLSMLYQQFTSSLPPYAVPCFIRITTAIEKTGTFKVKKSALQSVGFGPLLGSTVYYIDHSNKTYSELTGSIQDERQNGKISF